MIKFLPPGNTTVYRMGGIFYAWKGRDLRCQHSQADDTESRTTDGYFRAKDGDTDAREKLIEGNLRLVLSVIQRFCRPR